jgi:hypothetical protein
LYTSPRRVGSRWESVGDGLALGIALGIGFGLVSALIAQLYEQKGSAYWLIKGGERRHRALARVGHRVRLGLRYARRDDAARHDGRR